MKRLLSLLVSAALLLAVQANAQLGRGAGTVVFSFQGSTLFSTNGGFNLGGFTNSPAVVDVSKGKIVAIGVEFQGSHTTNSKNAVLVGDWLFTQNATARPTVAGASFRNSITQNGTSRVAAWTNIVDVGYPYLRLQLENPPDTPPLSNVVVRVFVK